MVLSTFHHNRSYLEERVVCDVNNDDVDVEDAATAAEERSLGVHFGESLLEPEHLLFQLHNRSLCSEASNGFALMRMEALLADEAFKFDKTAASCTNQPSLATCYCSPEDDDDEEEDDDVDCDDLQAEGDPFSLSSIEKPLVLDDEEEEELDCVAEAPWLSSFLEEQGRGPPSQPPPPPPRQRYPTSPEGSRVPTAAMTIVTGGSTASLRIDAHEPASTTISEHSTISGKASTIRFVGKWY